MYMIHHLRWCYDTYSRVHTHIHIYKRWKYTFFFFFFFFQELSILLPGF